jgi:hypothetical protein
MLTFEGANVDIYIGASAPLIAWLSTRGRLGLKLALGWNVLGLLALTNVVTRAVLTSPGPFNLINAEVSNRMFGTFPFMFIPGFFVPLAVLLHVLAIRAINGRLRTATSGAVSSGRAQSEVLGQRLWVINRSSTLRSSSRRPHISLVFYFGHDVIETASPNRHFGRSIPRGQPDDFLRKT